MRTVDNPLHTGSGRGMVDGRVCIFIALVILGVVISAILRSQLTECMSPFMLCTRCVPKKYLD